MKAAVLSKVAGPELPLWSVKIEEVGRYHIPAVILEGGVRSSALDVVDISVAPDRGRLILEARGNVVTTEMLSDDVRLQIQPKIPPSALDQLLAWSQTGATRLEMSPVPTAFSRDTGVYDLFATRFLASLEAVERSGWIPEPETVTLRSPDVRGTVRPARSVQVLLETGELAFEQTVNRVRYEADANRSVRTALLAVVRSKGRLDREIVERGIRALADMPRCEPFRDAREAYVRTLQVVRERRLDGSRAYFYEVLERALPILRALYRREGGDVEVEDLPIRIATDRVFEDAVRNVVGGGLPKGYRIDAGEETLLYRNAEPESFNAKLDPDLVVRRVGDRTGAAAVFDAKYKRGELSAADHQQLSAYVVAYEPRIGGFLTMARPGGESGVVGRATTVEDREVVEFALSADELGESARELCRWLRGQLSV